MVDSNKRIGRGKVFLDPIQSENRDSNIQIQPKDGERNLNIKPNQPIRLVARQSSYKLLPQQTTWQDCFKSMQPQKVLTFNATVRQSNNNEEEEEEEEEKKYVSGKKHNSYMNHTYNSFYSNNNNLNSKREQQGCEQQFTNTDYFTNKKHQESVKSLEIKNSNKIPFIHRGRNFSNYDDKKKKNELQKKSEELKDQPKSSELPSQQPIIKEIRSKDFINEKHEYENKEKNGEDEEEEEEEEKEEKNQKKSLNQLSQKFSNQKITTQNNVITKILVKNEDPLMNNYFFSNINNQNDERGIADVLSIEKLKQKSNEINSSPFQSMKKSDESLFKQDIIYPQDQINSLKGNQQDININQFYNQQPERNLFNQVNMQFHNGKDPFIQLDNISQLEFIQQQSKQQRQLVPINNNYLENQSLIFIPSTVFCDMCSRDIIDSEIRDHKIACELEEIPCEICSEMISRISMNSHFLNCIISQQRKQGQFFQQHEQQSQQGQRQQQQQQIQEQLKQLQEQENQQQIFNREQQRLLRQQEEEQYQQIREQRQKLQELQRKLNEHQRQQNQQIREQQRRLYQQKQQQQQQNRVLRVDLQEQQRLLSSQQQNQQQQQHHHQQQQQQVLQQLIGNQLQGHQRQVFTHVIYKSTDSQESCCICLNDFELSEQLGMLPCKHIFHKGCITEWIQTKKICPLCNISL